MWMQVWRLAGSVWRGRGRGRGCQQAGRPGSRPADLSHPRSSGISKHVNNNINIYKSTIYVVKYPGWHRPTRTAKVKSWAQTKVKFNLDVDEFS
jgi:hypothetical protein